jgi:hypothetical protein
MDGRAVFRRGFSGEIFLGNFSGTFFRKDNDVYNIEELYTPNGKPGP